MSFIKVVNLRQIKLSFIHSFIHSTNQSCFILQGGELREKADMYRGMGAPTPRSDPFEAFRKNKAGSFYTRMKDREKDRSSDRKSGAKKWREQLFFEPLKKSEHNILFIIKLCVCPPSNSVKWRIKMSIFSINCYNKIVQIYSFFESGL